MKKLILLIALNLIIVTPASAGFWGFMADTKELLIDNPSNYYSTNVDANEDNARIQQALAKLGFYTGKFTGDLNTFESRTAIEDFQLHYNLEDTGILSKTQEQDLLYMHDLLRNYKLELENPGDKNSKKLTKIFRALDKLENKLSEKKFTKTHLSIGFRKQISNRRIYLSKQTKEAELEKIRLAKLKLKAQERKRKKLASEKQARQARLIGKYVNNGNGTVTDKETGLTWMRCSIGQTWSGDTCTGAPYEIDIDELADYNNHVYAKFNDWRVPSSKELESIIYCSTNVREERYYVIQCLGGEYQRPTINKVAFPNTNPKDYWTSDVDNQDSYREYVYFYNGSIHSDKWGSKFVRLVRHVN